MSDTPTDLKDVWLTLMSILEELKALRTDMQEAARPVQIPHDVWAAQVRASAAGCGEGGRRDAEMFIAADAEIERKMNELNGVPDA